MQATNEAYIVSSVRTPVGKANKGVLQNYRPEDLGAESVKGAMERVDGLEPEMVDDVIMGCAFPEGPQGMNMGRSIAQKAGLPDRVPRSDREPVLLVRAANDRDGVAVGGHRTGGCGRRRRGRVDERRSDERVLFSAGSRFG